MHLICPVGACCAMAYKLVTCTSGCTVQHVYNAWKEELRITVPFNPSSCKMGQDVCFEHLSLPLERNPMICPLYPDS